VSGVRVVSSEDEFIAAVRRTRPRANSTTYTINAAAQKTGLKPWRIRRSIRLGEIITAKNWGRWMIPASELKHLKGISK